MPEPTLLHQLVDDAAWRAPDAPAVSHAGTALTYRDLADLSECFANWLHARGVGRGDRLVIRTRADARVPALLYAASRLGVVFTVLHEQVVGDSLRHVLTDCEPALVVTDAPENVIGAQVPVWALHEAAAMSRTEPPRGVRPQPLTVDPMCLIYTSGSTAMPKAVVSTHQQAMFVVQAIQSRLGYRQTDRVFCPLPLAFDYGLYQLFLAASSRAEVCLSSPAEAGAALLARLERTGATVLAGVPAVTEALIRLCRRAGRSPSALRLITNTGAALSAPTLAELRRTVPTARIQLMFGLTECKRISISEPDEDLSRPGTCGKPLPGTEVLVVDEKGAPVPAGEIGEFVVRGPHVMAGYWRRPELTAERFRLREGTLRQLHTGDYGFVDAEGHLYFAGRRDDLYKERGFRVSGTEVEAAARGIPGVAQAALLPPGDRRRHAVLVAVSKLTSAQVLDRMRGRIEEYKIPRHCVVVEELPLTGNGKIDRRALAGFAVPDAGEGRRV